MNMAKPEKQETVLRLLIDGVSMRAASRISGVSFNTIRDILIRAGRACAAFHDSHVRDVRAENVQVDEMWGFCQSKTNDVWTWVGIDPATKLVISYSLGDRSYFSATDFMNDLRSRLDSKPVIRTDGLRAYEHAIKGVFRDDADHDCTLGNDYTNWAVERQNLTVRMGVRRYTRKTNAFSKKLENMFYGLSIWYVYYNFIRIHQSLRVTPAMEAGITDKLYDMDLIVDMVNRSWAKPRRPKTYRKRVA